MLAATPMANDIVDQAFGPDRCPILVVNGCVHMVSVGKVEEMGGFPVVFALPRKQDETRGQAARCARRIADTFISPRTQGRRHKIARVSAELPGSKCRKQVLERIVGQLRLNTPDSRSGQHCFKDMIEKKPRLLQARPLRGLDEQVPDQALVTLVEEKAVTPKQLFQHQRVSGEAFFFQAVGYQFYRRRVVPPQAVIPVAGFHLEQRPVSAGLKLTDVNDFGRQFLTSLLPLLNRRSCRNGARAKPAEALTVQQKQRVGEEYSASDKIHGPSFMPPTLLTHGIAAGAFARCLGNFLSSRKNGCGNIALFRLSEPSKECG